MKYSNSTVSLYIHWPFCVTKCPYCDFNSHVNNQVDYQTWEKAYIKEIKNFVNFIGNRKIQTIYFGGGTPSSMPIKIATKIIDSIYESYKIQDGVEITLEANPNSTDAQKFKEFRKIGINRISVGIQSVETNRLKFLERSHSDTEGIKALEIVSELFPRYSFDLIYATPEQTAEQWERELRYALKFAKNHISLYQLTIESRTKFHQYYTQGKFKMPDDDLSRDLFYLTQKIMDSIGMPSYEISNYAKPGEESLHNLRYWHYCDYVGIGPGAHSRIHASNAGKHFAIIMAYKPEIWLKKVMAQNSGIQIIKPITSKEMATEYIMMGMRFRGGINTKDFYEKSGLPLAQSINTKNAEQLQSEGLIKYDKQSIRATEKGFVLLDSVILELLS